MLKFWRQEILFPETDTQDMGRSELKRKWKWVRHKKLTIHIKRHYISNWQCRWSSRPQTQDALCKFSVGGKHRYRTRACCCHKTTKKCNNLITLFKKTHQKRARIAGLQNQWLTFLMSSRPMRKNFFKQLLFQVMTSLKLRVVRLYY